MKISGRSPTQRKVCMSVKIVYKDCKWIAKWISPCSLFNTDLSLLPNLSKPKYLTRGFSTASVQKPLITTTSTKGKKNYSFIS